MRQPPSGWLGYVPLTRAEAHFDGRLVRCFAERPKSAHALLEEAVIGNPAMNSRHPDHLFEFFRRVCAEVDIAVALFNTNYSGYALSPELVGRLADIENIFCIKNPQPPDHMAAVRRQVGSRILVCDPTEARWLDNIVTHKDQVFMSSPSPYLLQTAGRLTMREYTRQAMAGDVDAARKFYVEKLRMKIVFDELAPNKDVWVVGLAPEGGGALVELLAAVAQPNPIQGFLDKHGEAIHHVAYEVQDIEAAIAQCKAVGFQMLDERPRPGAHKSRIAFIHPKSTGGVLSELVEPARH